MVQFLQEVYGPVACRVRKRFQLDQGHIIDNSGLYGKTLNNCRELMGYLHLEGSLVTSAAPYRRKGTKGKNGRPGCQVDLLIQTRRALYVVEVKRKREIGRDIIDEVDKKVRAIKRPEGVSARTALVYDGHLSPVDRANGYFDAIVPFSELLGLPANF